MSNMSWRDAIVHVLKSSPEAMNYNDIAERIVEDGLRNKVGATPSNSVATELSNSLRQEMDKSPFERVDRGYYTLRDHDYSQTRQHHSETAELDSTHPETGLINAFGMYWQRDTVRWPTMLGQQRAGSDTVDFSEQQGVYLLHDRREVIYVGRSAEQGLGPRLKQHITDRLSGRWDRFSWFGVCPVNDDGSLGTTDALNFSLANAIATMEALLIEGLEPRQNRKRGDDFRAVEFLQVVDPEIENDKKKEYLQQVLRSV